MRTGSRALPDTATAPLDVTALSQPATFAAAMKERAHRHPETRLAVGARLALVRKAAGITQVEVSEKLGRPPSWIAKLETGRRSLLFVEAVDLAELYGVSLTALNPKSQWS